MTEQTPCEERKYDLDWSRADPEMAKIILRQAELRLDAQLKIAIAADQRAMVSAGICAAFAAASATAAISNVSSGRTASISQPKPTVASTGNNEITAAGLAIAATLLCAAAIFLRCAKPTKFKVPGNEPAFWFEVRNHKNLAVALGGECENYQVWIEQNNDALAKNAKRYWLAVKVAATAPVVGLLIFLLCRPQTIPAFLRLW